eukprot:9727102-Lingulodinium_polyedra.AAC.1
MFASTVKLPMFRLFSALRRCKRVPGVKVRGSTQIRIELDVVLDEDGVPAVAQLAAADFKRHWEKGCRRA